MRRGLFFAGNVMSMSESERKRRQEAVARSKPRGDVYETQRRVFTNLRYIWIVTFLCFLIAPIFLNHLQRELRDWNRHARAACGREPFQHVWLADVLMGSWIFLCVCVFIPPLLRFIGVAEYIAFGFVIAVILILTCVLMFLLLRAACQWCGETRVLQKLRRIEFVWLFCLLSLMSGYTAMLVLFGSETDGLINHTRDKLWESGPTVAGVIVDLFILFVRIALVAAWLLPYRLAGECRNLIPPREESDILPGETVE